MARKRLNTVGQWMPSDEELRVIEYLAAGYSQNRVAAITGVPQQTISRWYKREEFRALVADRTVQFLESQGSVLEQSKALAQLIFHQGLTGERGGDDPALELAERFLSATVWRIQRGEQHLQFGSLRAPEPGGARLPGAASGPTTS